MNLDVSFQLLRSASVRVQEFSKDDLAALASYVLSHEHVKGTVELTLDFTNPRRIQALNRRFRGVDRNTDVIAFRYEATPHPHPLPQGEREPKLIPSPLAGEGRVRGGFAGDIAINVAQARLQAKKMRHPTRREIRVLWIHGILHLLGYTDYEPKPRRKMFKRQNELLRRWEKKHP